MRSIVMSLLNSLTIVLWELNPFGPNLFRFGWDFIDCDNFEGQKSKVLKSIH